MKARCLYEERGTAKRAVMFDLDFAVLPVAGDIIHRADEEGMIRQAFQVIRREFTFANDGEVPTMFVIITTPEAP